MKIDSGSLAFNININGKVGGTPSWGTAIVYQTEDNKIKEDIAKDILIGMVYKKIDCTSSELSLPLGKGGKVYYGNEDFNTNSAPSMPYLAARFEKTYINGQFIGKPFILLIMKDAYDAHNGRLQLKYSPKISWGVYKNQEFFDEAFSILQISPKAPFVCYSIEVIDQESLHFRCVYKTNEYTFRDTKEYNDFINAAIDVDASTNSHHINSHSCQTIYYGAPGTGKSHIVKKQTAGESVVRTTFHPDSDYSTFVGCYKPTTKQGPRYTSYGEKAVTIKDADGREIIEDRIVYEFVDQAFLQAYIKAWMFYILAEDGVDPEKQYLIIEEINRGNCAQIFGDLFQLLDRNDYGFSDYYIHADKDLRNHIAKAFDGLIIKDLHKDFINSQYHKGDDVVSKILSGEILLLPNNLFIWATMNTSDQSLFPIDSAFKRRWDWEYEPIKYKNINWVIDIEDSKYLWTSFQREINKRIFDATNSEDKMLGDYFVNPADGVITEKILLNKILFYLWNDVCKDGEGDIFKTADNEDVTFSDLHSDGGKDKLIAMMKYLKVQEIVEDTDTKEPSKQKNPKYSINNSEAHYSTPETVCRVIQEYAEQNQGMSVQEMIDIWNGISERNDCLVDSWAPSPKDKQPFANKRRSEIKWGDKSVWVTRGWTEEIFQTFIRNAKEQLGVIIEKVE